MHDGTVERHGFKDHTLAGGFFHRLLRMPFGNSASQEVNASKKLDAAGSSNQDLTGSDLRFLYPSWTVSKEVQYLVRSW